MNKPWDPNQPSEFLIRQVQDAIDYAAHANTPYTLEQVVNSVYSLVFNTGLFKDACKNGENALHLSVKIG